MKRFCLGLLAGLLLLCAAQEASAFGFFRPRNNVTVINNNPVLGVGGCGGVNLGLAGFGYGAPLNGGVNVNVGRVGFNRFGGVGRLGGGVRVAAPGVRVRVR